MYTVQVEGPLDAELRSDFDWTLQYGAVYTFRVDVKPSGRKRSLWSLPCNTLCEGDLHRVHLTCLRCGLRDAYYGRKPRVERQRLLLISATTHLGDFLIYRLGIPVGMHGLGLAALKCLVRFIKWFNRHEIAPRLYRIITKNCLSLCEFLTGC